MNETKLYLASSSPRRRELLDQIGVHYTVLHAEVKEERRPQESAEEFVTRVALDKARAGQKLIGDDPHYLILAADTVVVVDDEVLGKPADWEDAAAMLKKLSGRIHQVLTGVALVCGTSEKTALSNSAVSFRDITDDEIKAYWGSGEPQDKAGAYAIQGKAAVFIEHLEGSFSGVMGLPLYETAQLLSDYTGSLLTY